jgi:hypothetical protein
MARLNSPLVLLLFIARAACVPLWAQVNSSEPLQQVDPNGEQVKSPPASAPQHVRLPSPQHVRLPFAIGSTGTEYAHFIQVVPSQAMSRHDLDLVADAESSIQERAGFQSFEFNQGDWAYEQLDCPALPNHLLLRFSRNEGTREMSMFSATIPRNGEGKVRIIPILRKGYSLWSPAPIGPLTIAAFNNIRAEENLGTPADWLGTGLCYAALAGANPWAGQLQSELPGKIQLPATIPPTLMLTANGGAIVRFADLRTSRPMEWSLTFDSKGKLLKASHAPTYVAPYQPRVVPTHEINESAPTATQP